MYWRTVAISAVILLVLDSIYLYIFSKTFTDSIVNIQNGVAIKYKIPSIILCYLFLIAGINYFIIIPKRPIFDAFLLGIFVYGVYETTSYALLNKWPLSIAIIDTLWGGILLSLTTYITYIWW
jgi:uncharacterized membrane protein